jgi:transcriptional regulator with XRE-family HTH domain
MACASRRIQGLRSTTQPSTVNRHPEGNPSMPIPAGQRELGAFLRARRERLAPDLAPAGRGPRRRTPGLRREEVAELAGISVDWYVRLEQGRAVAPSRATVEALARALNLSGAERDHLRALARLDAGAPAAADTAVPAALRHVLDGIAQPAWITNRHWDLLGWNGAAGTLFGLDTLAPEERNVFVIMLTHPHARRLFGNGWAAEARRMVGRLRTVSDLAGDDPGFAALVARLDAGCREFAAWWRPHDVATAASGVKTMRDPVSGFVRFHYASFQPGDDPSLRLTIFSAGAHAPTTP